MSEGRKHLDVQGNEVGCDIGRAIREELAMDILKQSLDTLRMDREDIIQTVTGLALEAIQMSEEENRDRPEELEHEVSLVEQKKADVLDAFFSKQITKEEMRLVNERYDRELEVLRKRLEAARAKESITYETERLREDVCRQVTAIVKGETDSEVFYKNILDHMVVHKDQTVEVYLNLLPQKWTFVLERLQDANRCLRDQNASEKVVFQNDPSVSPNLDEEESQCLQGFEGGEVQNDPSVPAEIFAHIPGSGDNFYFLKCGYPFSSARQNPLRHNGLAQS